MILSEEFAAKARAIALDPIWNRQLSEIENLRELCSRHEADAERLAKENRELKELLQNEVGLREMRNSLRGVHGS